MRCTLISSLEAGGGVAILMNFQNLPEANTELNWHKGMVTFNLEIPVMKTESKGVFWVRPTGQTFSLIMTVPLVIQTFSLQDIS